MQLDSSEYERLRDSIAQFLEAKNFRDAATAVRKEFRTPQWAGNPEIVDMTPPPPECPPPLRQRQAGARPLPRRCRSP